MRDLDFILRYLDDLLAASTSHEEHLQHLRLASHASARTA